MESMPQETLKEIFDFLDPIDLFSVAMVCKAWNKISRDDKIWMNWKSDLKSQYFQWLKEQAAKYASGKTLDWIHPQGTSVVGKEYDYLLKLLLVGDARVGKSSILLRYTNDTFKDEYIATIGVDFKVKNLEFYPKIVKLQIWDTSGQQRFRTITSAYYRGAQGILVVYDVSDRNSFEHLEDFFDIIQHHALEGAVKFLVGNKQENSLDRAVGVDEAKEFATAHGCKYFEVSAKTGENITKVFVDMVKEIIPGLSPPPTPPDVALFLKRFNPIQRRAEPNKGKKEKCIVS